MIIINEGDGKGKTTAAIGQVIRAYGQGFKVKVIQFIKNNSSGEIEVLHKLGIAVEQYGSGFTSKGDLNKHKSMAMKALQAVEQAIDDNFDLIVCDEINYALNLIDEVEVLRLMERAKSKQIHLILTGRNPTQKMIELADIVTSMNKIKHAFDVGVKAQVGIEY